MQDNHLEAVSQSVEDGTYYKSARRWYSDLYHRPLAERSYFIVIILLALVNGYFAILSFVHVFPIATIVPFSTYSYDALEDLPRMQRLATERKEDRNVAVMRFFLKSYVVNREAYDIRQYEFRYRNIWSESDPKVFERYKATLDAANPYSPYRLYSNKAQRDIDILSVNFERGADISHAQIIFLATVSSTSDGTEISRSKWQADLTYRYTDFVVDQSLDEHAWVARLLGLTGKEARVSGEKRKVVPMTFRVLDYQVKELLE